MGTIPGPILECDIGESVTVHFRNADLRPGLTELQRCHSLHPHGFVFAPASDGAYPLSPPDSTQAIDAAERAAWDSVNVTGQFKKGDRVPPDATFDYTWIAGAP